MGRIVLWSAAAAVMAAAGIAALVGAIAVFPPVRAWAGAQLYGF